MTTPKTPAPVRSSEIVSRLEQELADTKSLLRFQEMHKSAEMLKDKNRMDWLLKNSCIIVNGLYLTCRESVDVAMTPAEPANDQAERRG